MEMNHYLINKNRTSYGCNVTKDKNLKKKIYIFFYDISTTNTNSIKNTTLLLFYTKSSPGSVLLLGGILGIRQSQSKI